MRPSHQSQGRAAFILCCLWRAAILVPPCHSSGMLSFKSLSFHIAGVALASVCFLVQFKKLVLPCIRAGTWDLQACFFYRVSAPPFHSSGDALLHVPPRVAARKGLLHCGTWVVDHKNSPSLHTGPVKRERSSRELLTAPCFVCSCFNVLF